LVGLNADEQFEMTRRIVLGVLAAAFPRFEGKRVDREDYDTLCGAQGELFQIEIVPLQFARTQ
jgi:hypothetical protein